jgi:hypothetical protein
LQRPGLQNILLRRSLTQWKVRLKAAPFFFYYSG